jgi:transposase InsO family protein
LIRSGTALKVACREFGVTPKTARKWVRRAEQQGLENLAELSRAPHRSPSRTAPCVEEAVLSLRDEVPAWGGRKLAVVLRDRGGPTVHPRTAERILSRHGRTLVRAPVPEMERFERPLALDLIQQDFKGMPRGCPYSVLTVLDDSKRFCLGFEPVKDKTAASVKGVLWQVFERYGMPGQALMDNGDCWGALSSKGPSALEAWLMLLGVEPIHGRPHHPQTQGKVERFHRTAGAELGANLHQSSIDQARTVYRPFVARYNWVRPHEALGMKTPGSQFHPQRTKRPDELPKHQIPEGATTRSVDDQGYFSYKGQSLRIGAGLGHQTVVLQARDLGTMICFAGFDIALVEDLR